MTSEAADLRVRDPIWRHWHKRVHRRDKHSEILVEPARGSARARTRARPSATWVSPGQAPPAATGQRPGCLPAQRPPGSLEAGALSGPFTPGTPTLSQAPLHGGAKGLHRPLSLGPWEMSGLRNFLECPRNLSRDITGLGVQGNRGSKGCGHMWVLGHSEPGTGPRCTSAQEEDSE